MFGKDIDRHLTPSFCHLSLLSDAKVAKPLLEYEKVKR